MSSLLRRGFSRWRFWRRKPCTYPEWKEEILLHRFEYDTTRTLMHGRCVTMYEGIRYELAAIGSRSSDGSCFCAVRLEPSSEELSSYPKTFEEAEAEYHWVREHLPEYLMERSC